MPSKHELNYGEVHPGINRAEVFLTSLKDEDWKTIESELRKGMGDSNRECTLLWPVFSLFALGKAVTPENLLYLTLYIHDILLK